MDEEIIVAALLGEKNDLARVKLVRDHVDLLGRHGVQGKTKLAHQDALVTARLITRTAFEEVYKGGVNAAKANKAQRTHSPTPTPPASDLTDLTDDANANRLIEAYQPVIRRVSDMGSWWRWTEQRWDRDYDDAFVREAAKKLARELPQDDRDTALHKRISMSSAGLSSAIRVAQSDPRITVLARDMDGHPELLNTANGVLNLRTGALGPHDPALMLTRATPGPVDLGGEHPRWDAFLDETFGGDSELIAYVRRLCGLALLGDVRDHILPLLYGSGANGKGVLLLVLQGLLGVADTGGYAVSAPDGFLMTSTGSAHPTEIARLRGARLVVCSEQTSGRRFDEARVKRLTGGDLLTGRFMRGDFFDFPPSHLVVVATNHLPEVREGGPSFWRRVRLIPFDHVVPPDRRDPELHARLLDLEGAAILGWMARGAQEVIHRGLGEPARVMAATDDYRVSEDTLASFVRDECTIGPNWWCSVPDFRSRYETHCSEMGVEALSAKAVGMRLTREYPVTPDRLSRPARRVYRGIGLLADGPEGDDG
ncbi:phage/plasmid primase, P4 family [Frankia sp. AvcI1]|uniref:DNA primase family protein n=1 Tax=Frankia sp. AvcI1 TaxID=573496 RepID=UPI002118A36F|nr:phage/plasmid primase, P4 family [Frankia sp. AvcI1]